MGMQNAKTIQLPVRQAPHDEQQRQNAKTIQLLVLQSTAFCNIDCRYCYLPNRNVKGRMQDEVLSRVAVEIIPSRYWVPSSLVLWHAGEPLSLGPAWYAHAHEVLDGGTGRLKRIQFQSNGTPLDERWIDFLHSSGAMIGLSIDGPKWLHDKHRKDRAGNGTFEKVMAAARRLHAAGIGFTNIATVTEDSLSSPDEIFDFFQELRPKKLAFSIEEAEGANPCSTLYQDAMLDRVAAFFQRIALRNFASPSPLRIREIESVIAALIAPAGRFGQSQETELGRIIAIGTRGDVAVFSPELLTTRQSDGRFLTVGNILDQPFDDILNGDVVRSQSSEIEKGVDACRATCRFFGYCGGGSPANKYFETGRFDISETWYCRVAKKATVRGVLKAIAAQPAAAS
jgi:uncharacterized protein